MEIYFNPYPSAAKTEEEGMRLAVGTADALLRMQRECNNIFFASKISEAQGDLPISNFVLYRKFDTEFNIASIITKAKKADHDKLVLLLRFFSKGKVIDKEEIKKSEDWILSGICTAAPILELAAKNKAIALTIPTEPEWRVNLFKFINRTETLYNLWGQDDISEIISHCVESIKNIPERFSVQFNAEFCGNALNSAPDFVSWDNLGFFRIMEIARKRKYKADDDLIRFAQGVEKTKYGTLFELRLKASGCRMFFVYREGHSPEILIGGFYKKGTGDDSKAQNHAIQNAQKNIDVYSGA